MITHSGKFKCLPSTNGVNSGFLAPGMPLTLLSLGHVVHGELNGHSTGTLSGYVPGYTPTVNVIELGLSNLSRVCFSKLLRHLPAATTRNPQLVVAADDVALVGIAESALPAATY